MIRLDLRFRCISGLTSDDLCFIAMRFPASLGFKPAHSDSWICRKDAGGLRLLYGLSGWGTGLWYSGRQLWMTQSRGKLVHFSELGATAKGDRWTVDELPAALMGVWGLGDDHVIAWADRDLKSGIMFRWNGKKWATMPSPGFGVLDVHGVAKDLIYAVGRRGLLARWNGKAWKKLRSGTTTDLNAVRVIDDGEMYAVGSDGSLLRGSTRKWELMLSCPASLYGVAKFAGQLWAAADSQGVAMLHDGKLKVAKANLEATRFDSRQQLMASCPDQVAVSKTGKSWQAVARKREVLDMLKRQEPLWV